MRRRNRRAHTRRVTGRRPWERLPARRRGRVRGECGSSGRPRIGV